MFSSSLQKYNLCYKWYVGDGDSSLFSELANAKPYEDTVVIEKGECIGHVQKRMGTRCRSLKHTLKSTILSDGKRIAGRGRLTAINPPQNHYGMGIRQNTDSIDNIKRSHMAVFAIIQMLQMKMSNISTAQEQKIVGANGDFIS